MTQEDKLKAIISKAVENGWEGSTDILHYVDIWEGLDIGIADYFHYLFQHSFAKAIWGEEPGKELAKLDYGLLHWQHHLQQAVISEDPIDYYYENL